MTSYIIKIKVYIKFVTSWFRDVVAFEKFIKNNQLDEGKFEKEGNLQRIAIIVHPWLMTPTPFFSFASGLFLKKRGNHIDFLIDDLNFGKSKILYKIQISSIKYISRFLKNSFKVSFLSELEPSEEFLIVKDQDLRNLCSQNAVHFFKGELLTEGRLAYEDLLFSQMQKARPYIHQFFLFADYDCIHLSGGIYGTTGIYLAYAKHFNIRANTFDAGFGVLVSSTNGIAAQLSDIPYSVALLKNELSEAQFDIIKQKSIDQLQQRKAGTDIFGFLDSGINDNLVPEDVGVLILLNSVWDSAALGINNIYDGYVDWLISTIKLILTNTEKKITVRQHPGEKLDYQMPSDDLNDLIKKTFGNSDRILFVDCYSKINTYQLIDACEFVICYSSTSGIESVILGKNVIVASKCYYSGQNFVNKPTSKSHYLEQILSCSKSEIKEINVNEAIMFYYLGQCCNWNFTDFTPMPADFKKWVKNPQIYKTPEANLYFRSIEEYLPISLLICRNNIKAFEI